MKKIIGVLAIGLLLLAGCAEEGQVSAGVPEGFMNVTNDEIDDDGDHTLSVFQHLDTGCYFAVTHGYSYDSSSSITQMYVERNGVSVPYCELFND